jgi:hypothetical protein
MGGDMTYAAIFYWDGSASAWREKKKKFFFLGGESCSFTFFAIQTTNEFNGRQYSGGEFR